MRSRSAFFVSTNFKNRLIFYLKSINSHKGHDIMEKKHTFLNSLIAVFCLATLPACASTEIILNGHPESIAEDDDIFYISCIGSQMTPNDKDGDGFIATVSPRGRIISANAFPGIRLDAPKGIVIDDDILYVADVDRIVGINPKAGIVTQIFDLSKEGTKYLNDLIESNGFLYVSATDINKIFRVNLRNGTYEEIITTEPLNAPNGLDIEDGVLYIAEYATDANGNPAGKIKAVPVNGSGPRPVSVIYNVPGLYDGIVVQEEEDLFDNETDYLYFSDWAVNGKPGVIKKLNLRTREVENATRVPANGPADFIIEDGAIWIPAMLDKKVHID